MAYTTCDQCDKRCQERINEAYQRCAACRKDYSRAEVPERRAMDRYALKNQKKKQQSFERCQAYFRCLKYIDHGRHYEKGDFVTIACDLGYDEYAEDLAQQLLDHQKTASWTLFKLLQG